MALTEAQRAELYAKIPSGGYDGSISSRARIVLHDERHSVAEIAGMMDTSKVTVYKWVDRYHEGGLPALESRKSTGRPREISGEVRSRILALSRQTPPGETGLSHWSSQEMARYLKKREGIAVSHNFVAVLWRENGIQPHRQGTFKLSPDPEFAAKVMDIVGLYLDPPEGAVVLSLDEKTQVQAYPQDDQDVCHGGQQNVLPVSIPASDELSGGVCDSADLGEWTLRDRAEHRIARDLAHGPQDTHRVVVADSLTNASASVRPVGTPGVWPLTPDKQALDRTQPLLPVTFGKTEKRTHDYVRHGTTNLFAALNTGTGEVTGACYQRRRTREFLKFMDQVTAKHPDGELHVILDNLSTHSGEAVDRWLTRHRNVTLHFTPVGSSWMNQIEIWFGIITRRAIRRGTFGSVRQLINAIGRYVSSWNEDAAPFEWIATADEIISKVAILERDFRKLLANNAR